MPHFMHMVLAGLVRWPDAPLIRPFSRDAPPGTYAWGLITFAEFHADLERTAAHYQKLLRGAGVPPGAVVGLWLTGAHVTDLVHLYALARAGFVPQLFSLKFSLPGQAVVRDLLRECGAGALLHDAHFATLIAGLLVPTLETPDVASLPPAANLAPLPEVADCDVAIIFHTSGTTGGRPKPVPQSHGWCRAHSQVCWRGVWQGEWDSPDVVNNIGSFAHMGAATYIYKSAFSGGSFVQTSQPNIGADELLAMVRQCGLNRLLQYASWLSELIAAARENAEVLAALQGLRQVAYTGVSMNPEDEAWALAHGIPITSMYGTTETAQCMVSDLGARDTLLHPIPQLGLQLVPAAHAGAGLLDLFLPLSAPNCPHAAVRNRPDGHVTGDLFEAVCPGYYAFRGRSDDWIKTGHTRAAFCDTKAIEDNVLRTCADLVRNVVAVGHLRPCVVLLVEPLASADICTVKKDILRRTEPFNARLMEHERVCDEGRIVLVPVGALPRTSEKGNIRRKAAHEQFEKELEAIWADV